MDIRDVFRKKYIQKKKSKCYNSSNYEILPEIDLEKIFSNDVNKNWKFLHYDFSLYHPTSIIALYQKFLLVLALFFP